MPVMKLTGNFFLVGLMGAGKTTVMAMIIAWQTINAVRRPNSKNFSRGFLVVAPGLTIKDRLRVLQPHDPQGVVAALRSLNDIDVAVYITGSAMFVQWWAMADGAGLALVGIAEKGYVSLKLSVQAAGGHIQCCLQQDQALQTSPQRQEPPPRIALHGIQ